MRLAELAGNIINICKTVLSVVRTIIRDLITDALAKIVMIICRYPPPAYPAALAAEGVPFAIEKSTEAVSWSQKLMRVLLRAKSMLTDFYKNVGDLIKKGDVFEGAGMGAFWEVVKEAGKTAFREVVKSASEDSTRDKAETTIGTPGGSKPSGGAAAPAGARRETDAEPIFEQLRFCTPRWLGKGNWRTTFTVSTKGIRWYRHHKLAFDVGWEDIRELRLTSVTDGKRTMWLVDFFPVGDKFAKRRPELKGLWEIGAKLDGRVLPSVDKGYRLPEAFSEAAIEQVRAAMLIIRPGRLSEYAGTVQSG